MKNHDKKIINQLITLEEDVKYQEYALDGQEEFSYTPGQIPVLLSAPHGARHTRPAGEKAEDEYTAGIARLVAKFTGAHVIYARRKSSKDPNWHSDCPYKRRLLEITQEQSIKFIFDIHGAKDDKEEKPCGIALGTIGGQTCVNEKEKIIQIFARNGFTKDAEDYLSRLDVDNFFKGKGKVREGQETIIRFLHKKIPSAQFEINALLRIPERRPDAFGYNKDKLYKGEPERIIQTIKALIDLVQELSK